MSQPTKPAMAFARELLAHYPGRTVSEGNVRAIAEALDVIGLTKADDVCALLATRSVDPPSVAQVFQTAREVGHDTMSVGFDYNRCIRLAHTECPQCHVVHGEPLSEEVQAHGFQHLRLFMREGSEVDRVAMYDPAGCECGFVPEPAS